MRTGVRACNGPHCAQSPCCAPVMRIAVSVAASMRAAPALRVCVHGCAMCSTAPRMWVCGALTWCALRTPHARNAFDCAARVGGHVVRIADSVCAQCVRTDCTLVARCGHDDAHCARPACTLRHERRGVRAHVCACGSTQGRARYLWSALCLRVTSQRPETESLLIYHDHILTRSRVRTHMRSDVSVGQ